MIDFHSHFLPGIDDGADSVRTSLSMLRESRRQGVDLIFATPHFYADEDDPKSFLLRRNEAYARVLSAASSVVDSFPGILLGAEILYFPGMSVADELYELRMGSAPLILIEPPMIPWSDSMLDEIELTGRNLQCIPVIAHVDRYMRILRDNSLFDRLKDRQVLIQVNAGCFIRSASRAAALEHLRDGRIHFIGSDCHNMRERAPNMGEAAEIIARCGAAGQHEAIDRRLSLFLEKTRRPDAALP